MSDHVEHKRPVSQARAFLPGHVAAEHDVTSHHGVLRLVVVDEVGHDRRGHGELDRGSVDDADDVARARGAQGAEEGAAEAVLGVELDDLLVVVGALQQLDACVERAAVGLEHDLHRLNNGLEGVGAERAALDGGGRAEALLRRALDALVVDPGGEGELELADVA
eukprot:scaffold15256_cov126-Isochrysis_galbana.AAC.3